MFELDAYYQPESLAVALELLAKSDGKLRPLAGGTDLVPALAKRKIHCPGLIDLSAVSELRAIIAREHEIQIGSMSTFAQIEEFLVIRNRFPLLSEAAASVGSPQIRNTGTIGGNIANASPAADMVTALIALEAEVRLDSSEGFRTVPLQNILEGAGKTHIRPQEIITNILIRPLAPGSRSGYIKLGRRRALAIARLNLAVILAVHENKISLARVALGAVGPNPCRSSALETTLEGQQISSTLVDTFASEAEKEVVRMLGSRPSVSYKQEAVKGIARELLPRLFSSTEGVVA
ncbi:CO dehydrogenase flavoprotein C-terminal domain [Acididesulfobacillus acetoxydans]|uniref:Aerobic-type carbon monoxide dehydrogenase, middle subunit CoxM/CutM-like protein n=1 Tax=Acididesulfobacillus acetoxydans TaxID=1561005 RepID=A0A8S0W2N2_9FIRM|nr:FAD binding domain-containing protein [Acididesulfobacillus acetoxydans]CAA7600818.1 CO dehydrogenase flavoprotein C-terminal domain [Acididesulfobacillus acetoxydans]CEJ09239.1 Aerobic-type carbon monoxide dehydrogenase, middle subunit CoxM/CutM-like protein [Acididesulfobacillus acetoxydans]